jgi:hypothetical protein
MNAHSPDTLQKVSMSLMVVLILLTFILANVHALLWQSSQWLVSTVLPAVVVDLTNDERADIAAAPLRRNSTLDAAAQLKAQHMADNQYFAHFAPDGTSPWHWFSKAGYSYAHAGENLAIHFTDSSELVEAWMKSPKHRENIVNTVYTEIGVGTAKGSYDGYDTVYVVQLFGTPAVTTLSEKTPVVAKNDTVVRTATTTPATTTTQVAGIADDVVPVVPNVPVAVSSKSKELSFNQTPATSENKKVARISNDTEKKDILTQKEIVVLETTIATSSGLAVASIEESIVEPSHTTTVGLATKPHRVLQFAYTALGIIVVAMLLVSIVIEARQRHFFQIGYSLSLLLIMVGLWYAHVLLTTGAVIA